MSARFALMLNCIDSSGSKSESQLGNEPKHCRPSPIAHRPPLQAVTEAMQPVSQSETGVAWLPNIAPLR